MIKILFFIDTLAGGGAEKVLRTLVNNMDQSRFAITVMTAFPEDAEKYLAPGIAYRSLYRRNNKINQLLLRVEAELGLTYRLRIRGDYDIEVAYLECAPTKIMAGSTNKKALKLAWVHCDLEKKVDDSAAFVAKTRPWYRNFHKVVFVSENARDSFVRMYGPEFDTVVLHNVNDEAEILEKAGEFVHKQDSRKVLAAVGRLSYEKGVDRLVEAVALLKREEIPFVLRVLGEGPERHALEAMIAKNGLSDHVELLGFQSNPYPYMQAADVIVCPSRYEGFSTVVTEALILGKPVVTTECSGMRELLGDSEYGLITENSEQGIYEGIKKMLTQPEVLAAYEDRACQRGKLFSKERTLRQTEDFFISELAKKQEIR